MIVVVLASVWLSAAARAGDPPVTVVKTDHFARLSAENLRLRKHLKGYGIWVRKLRRENRLLRRKSDWHTESKDAIRMAALAYGQSEATLLRKADCESGFWPYADNPNSDATGLFQFMPGTFRSTPYAGFSIWDVHAQALAAAWMHRVGRGGEWVCS